MNDYSKTSTYILISAVLSLGVHFGLLFASGNVPIHVFAQEAEEEKPKRLEVNTVDIRDIMRQKPKTTEVKMRETEEEISEVIKANTEKVKKIFEEQHLIKKPKPKLKLSGLGKSAFKPKVDTAPPQIAAAPRPEILEIDAQNLPSDRAAIERPLSPKLQRKNVDKEYLPSLVSADGYQQAVGKTLSTGMKLTLPKMGSFDAGSMPERPRDSYNAEHEGKRTGFVPFASLPGLESQFGSRTAEGGSPIDEMDKLLDVRMHTYGESDGSGFFRIDIAPNPQSDRLKAISKDILFLIDSSTSISPRKLEHFKEAVLEALAYLNRNDRFNIVAFRDRPDPLFSDYTVITDGTLNRARQFLKQLQRGGMTDVYAGLAPYVKTENNQRSRPLNVFLMTDGKSTVKNALTNEAMIRQVAALNKADVSVYTFSAGKDANRFLMDFLAYTNRGMSLHQEELVNFKDQLVGFIATHSELIVSDLRYQITGGMGGSIYPKKLPHLYRGETLSVYGRYPADAKELAIQIIGRDAGGNLEELVFRGNINSTRQSDSTLARDWAVQKIFYLIARRTLSPNSDVVGEIRRLARKHHLFVPYL